jgi:ATP phosphoribosyltransferase
VLPEELRARTDLTLLSMHDEGLSLLAPKARAQAEAEALIARGATTAVVSSVEYVFEAKNALYEKLEAKLA